MRPRDRNRNPERGIAMVIALLVLMVLTLLGLVVMSTVTMERDATGQGLRSAHALNNAEAGVSEALARIQSGEADLDTTRAASVAQIFLCASGSVPVLGADSTGLATDQPQGSQLPYSSPARGPEVLTVAFKTDAGRARIRRYDPALAEPENYATGQPVYVVTATGREGNARRTVVAEFIRKPITASLRGALVTNVYSELEGSCHVCGYNHAAGTLAGDGSAGRGTVGGATPDVTHCWDNEAGFGDVPGLWTTAGASVSAGTASGYPSASSANNATPFYAGPWETVGMTQVDFLNWIGSPTTSPASLNGIVRYDNNSVLGDRSAGSYNLNSNVDGAGFLYVDGNLRINGNITFRGLIYVEGDLTMNGSAWVLGGVVVKGASSLDMSGNATILYSSDAMAQALTQAGMQFVTLSWRER